ncbi:hypothetical protein ACN469_13550 [Corallococcus terminator]
MAGTGAPAALRGYRLQALYTLHRILSDKESAQLVFRLEGHEDLDILDATGRVLEVIQIKAYQDTLTLSELKPRKPESFFHRVLSRRSAAPDILERIVSFGPYGLEMVNAWAGHEPYRGRVVRQFEEWDYTVEQAERLLATVTLGFASERELTDAVFTVLRNSFTGTDPSAAFDLLHAWLFQIAESRKSITQRDIEERLTKVSRFLADRATHHAEWFTTIVPLDNGSVANAEELGKEFYQGISARYEHILSGADIIRRDKLDAIEQAFSKARVVVVRGASGQGKSALAHRFLHDYVPSASRFRVRLIQDRRHALSIARALTGHLSTIGALAYIHVEVSPGDTAWTELVDGLYEQRSARILVTIREEDWLRASIDRSSLRFEEVALQLEEAEARLIHARLTQHRPSPQNLDFEESWARFGGRGPLLEFTYLVTQHDTLHARLEAQVLRLRERATRLGRQAEAELELLRRTAVASAYGARLNVVLLAGSIGLSEPSLTIQRLEREYLIRTDGSGQFVDGLHPVRSAVLVTLLTNTAFTPWIEVAVRALPQIVESDLGTFLLHTFSRHKNERSRLARELGTIRPSTWDGTAQVFRALLWMGLNEYITDIEPVTTSAKAIFGSGWFAALPIDVGEVQAISPGLTFSVLDSLSFIPEEARRTIQGLRARLSSSRHLFSAAQQWLVAVSAGITPPASTEGWAAVAECIFWAARLEVALPWGQEFFHAYETALDSLPLNVAADVAYALSFHPNIDVHKQLARLNPKAIVRARQELQVFMLEQDDQRIAAHFLMDPAFIAGHEPDPVAPSLHSSSEKLSPNREAVRRARLLRSFLPGRHTYATQGYGQRSSLLPMEYDETTKELETKYLPPEWATRLNGMLINLITYPDRPKTWEDHAVEVLHLRQSIIDALEMLHETLQSYFRGMATLPLVGTRGVLSAAKWEKLCNKVAQIPLLPQVAVDEWGFTSEQSDEFGAGPTTSALGARASKQSLQSLALLRHREYLDLLGKYARAVRNFMSQIGMPLALQPLLARGSARERRSAMAVLRNSGEEKLNTHLPTVNLAEAASTVLALQQEYQNRFKQYILDGRLEQTETRETELLRDSWALWLMFVYSARSGGMSRPTQWAVRKQDDAGRAIIDGLRTRLTSLSASILSEDIQWGRDSALWLQLDFGGPENLHQEREALLEALHATFRRNNVVSIDFHISRIKWRHILIIPTFLGKAFARTAWSLRMDLISQTSPAELGWWNHSSHPVSEIAWNKLGVDLWQHPFLNWANEVVEPLVRLGLRLDLVLGVHESIAPLEIDTLGHEVMDNYYHSHEEPITSATQRIFAAAEKMAEWICSPARSSFPMNSSSEDILPGLRAILDWLSGTDADEGPKARAERMRRGLSEAIAIAEHVRLKWAAAVTFEERNTP